MTITTEQKQLYVSATDFFDEASVSVPRVAQLLAQLSSLLSENQIGSRNRAILKAIVTDDSDDFADAVANANDQLFAAYALLDQLQIALPQLEAMITTAEQLRPSLNLTEPEIL